MCSLIAIRDAVMNRMDDFWKSLQEAVSKVTDTASFVFPLLLLTLCIQRIKRPFGFFLVSQSLSFCSTNLSVGCLSYSPNTSLTKNNKKNNTIPIVVLLFFSYLCKENHSLDAVAPRGRVGM